MSERQVTLYVNREFSAAHYLPNYNGPCRRLHGHTFRAEVWIRGSINPDTGMVADFTDVKDVIDQLDHQCLNDTFDNPTAEHLALFFFETIPNCIKVRVWESGRSYAEVQSE